MYNMLRSVLVYKRKGQFVLNHISVDQMPVDHLIKVGNIQEYCNFTQQILGLPLLTVWRLLHPTLFQQKQNRRSR